jgi:predicted nucleotidyltransferase
MNPQYTLIYETIVGSTAYGTNIETSDVDLKGIAIPDIRHIFGIHPFEQHLTTKDHTIYALKKFFSLAQDCNPNIVEMLYTDESDVRYMDKYGKILRDNRGLFLSRRVKHTFSGYAFAQLQRIKNHRKWINNPQVCPVRDGFIHQQPIQLADKSYKMVERFAQTEYDAAFKKYQQYEEWKKNRNPERAALEAKCGFDGKHGSHLIRLARMGKEILSTGQVMVKRPDWEYLLAIRRGDVVYEDVVKEAEDIFEEMGFLYGISPLPDSPDMTKIENLLLDIQYEFYGRMDHLVCGT